VQVDRKIACRQVREISAGENESVMACGLSCWQWKNPISPMSRCRLTIFKKPGFAAAVYKEAALGWLCRLVKNAWPGRRQCRVWDQRNVGILRFVAYIYRTAA